MMLTGVVSARPDIFNGIFDHGQRRPRFESGSRFVPERLSWKIAQMVAGVNRSEDIVAKHANNPLLEASGKYGCQS